jgi:hypothetical protein
MKDGRHSTRLRKRSDKRRTPQMDAASRIVAWATHGALQPTGNDFAMLRLVLLALLPQVGGILLMVGRSAGAAADQVRAGDQSQNPKRHGT